MHIKILLNMPQFLSAGKRIVLVLEREIIKLLQRGNKEQLGHDLT